MPRLIAANVWGIFNAAIPQANSAINPCNIMRDGNRKSKNGGKS